MTASASMTTSNPKIDGAHRTVPKLIDQISRSADKRIEIKGSVPIPEWTSDWNPDDAWSWHLQGLAPYNGFPTTIANGCVTASANTGYFATFSQEQGKAPQVRAVILPDPAYEHAAGIQLLGDYLAVPLEKGGLTAKVVFYDVSDLAKPVELYSFLMPAHNQKASALALTSFTDAHGVEQALLGVWDYDNHVMVFFQAKVEDLGGGSSPWVQSTLIDAASLQGDQYECFSMVTQANEQGGDTVYLAGFAQDEKLHLFTVETRPPNVGALTKVAVYDGWKGTNWRVGGIGLEIVDPNTLRILGTAKDPRGTTSDYTIDMYVWESSG